MQDHVKFLVVDDVHDWAIQLEAAVADYFIARRKLAKARVRGLTAFTASEADDQLAGGGWDLVLLDMNLGDGAALGARGRISGLDLLGDIARGNRAYFVIIVTGAVTDPDLERVYGPDAAALIRFGAANEAVKMMPAARVRILHKPDADSVAQAMTAILPHLHSALDQYCSVSLERNIFRALPGDPALIEICYNGGPRLTLRFDAHFRIIQCALAQPNRRLEVTALIHRMAQASGVSESVSPAEARDLSEQPGIETVGALYQPVDTSQGAMIMDSIVGGLLTASRERKNLGAILNAIVTDMNIDEAALLSIPGVAYAWANKDFAADVEFGVDNAASALRKLAKELMPWLAPIKERWLAEKSAQEAAIKDNSTRPREKSAEKATKKLRVATGADPKEMQLARQQWSRFKEKISKHPALREFHAHMVAWVDRNPTSRAHLFYRPPNGELCPFWLTD